MTRRVLVVDDNQDLAEDLAEILECEGYETAVADGPRRALEQARSGRFDVAVIDIRMPGMDGVSLYGELVRLQPDATYLLMTAFTTDERISDAVKAGVSTVLPKPLPIEELLKSLPPADRGDPLTVLVVEDDRELRDGLLEVLREHGYEASAVGTIEGARAAVETGWPDAFVVDVHLPDGDGTQLVCELAQEHPRVPAVLVTGFDPEPALAAVRTGGRYHVLTKPFSPESLLETLQLLGSESPPPS
jgi:DNA-binding NtrC family response regulator